MTLNREYLSAYDKQTRISEEEIAQLKRKLEARAALPRNTLPMFVSEAEKAAAAYVPQEYPKMVPGPDGPTVVHDANEERDVLTARVYAMAAKCSPHYPGFYPAEAAATEAAATEVAATEVAATEVAIDVDAWNNARRAPQYDWIAALYRPYVPVA